MYVFSIYIVMRVTDALFGLLYFYFILLITYANVLEIDSLSLIYSRAQLGLILRDHQNLQLYHAIEKV